MEVVRSLYFDQNEILNGILQLYCPNGFECDMTYGNGSFWKNIEKPKYCYDIDPQCESVVNACSELLPHDSESLQNVVFDPPFLTYVKNGRGHKDGKVAMSSRFGGYWNYEELEEHYRHSISEAHRVLKPKGIMVFKCQDIIHNHKMHCTHQNVINWAEWEGFRLRDLFILAAKHRMPSPQKGTQKHARVWHSYFLVLEKQNSRKITWTKQRV